MSRRRKRWGLALGFALLLVLQGLSCERKLSDSIEPAQSWLRQLLHEGDKNVGIDEVLYSSLGAPIDTASATTDTVQLVQVSGSALLASGVATGPGALVPGELSFFFLDPKTGAFKGIAFDPLCDLYPLTQYQLVLKGLLWLDGTPVPDLEINFTTGDVPKDLPNPFYCDELVLPLSAYDLSDFDGINGGLAADPAWNGQVHLVAVGIANDPPIYKKVLDPIYYFGYADSGTYTSSDNWLAEPPYQVLVYLNNPLGSDLDLSLTPGFFNVRPYWPRLLLDSFEDPGAWTSSDPLNTPVSLTTLEMFEGFAGLQITLSGLSSLDDSVSRSWTGGLPAQATGIMFAVKAGNVSSGDLSSTRLELRLTDSAGNVVGSNLDILGLSTDWIFFTRALPGDFYPIAGAAFDQTKVSEIAFVQVGNGANDFVGDLFIDYLTVGDMTDVPVNYPPVVITPFDSLPLYVDENGSTYWAYNAGGVHVLNLNTSNCYTNCPLLDPAAALVKSNLAQAAP
jgi:hypothetical protein